VKNLNNSDSQIIQEMRQDKTHNGELIKVLRKDYSQDLNTLNERIKQVSIGGINLETFSVYCSVSFFQRLGRSLVNMFAPMFAPKI